MKAPLFKFMIIFLLLFSLNKIGNSQSLKNGSYLETIGNLKIHYTIRGQGPILIVGHLSSGMKGYELTLQPLEAYFTMVYYDPRGTGKSDTPTTLLGYQQDSIVAEIEALRLHLNVDKIFLFGHSDQSAISLIYALQYPEHTAGLILTGTSYVGTQEATIISY